MANPALTQADEALHRAMREQEFWDTHYQDLVTHYPDTFVAVRDGAVIATDAHLAGLLDELERRGIAPTDVWVQFLATDLDRLML